MFARYIATVSAVIEARRVSLFGPNARFDDSVPIRCMLRLAVYVCSGTPLSSPWKQPRGHPRDSKIPIKERWDAVVRYGHGSSVMVLRRNVPRWTCDIDYEVSSIRTAHVHRSPDSFSATYESSVPLVCGGLGIHTNLITEVAMPYRWISFQMWGVSLLRLAPRYSSLYQWTERICPWHLVWNAWSLFRSPFWPSIILRSLTNCNNIIVVFVVQNSPFYYIICIKTLWIGYMIKDITYIYTITSYFRNT